MPKLIAGRHMGLFLGPAVRGGVFVPFSTVYGTPGTQTVSVPGGASTYAIETIGAGGGGFSSGVSQGGHYSKKNATVVAGVTALYLDIPVGGSPGSNGAATIVRQNTSGGTILCQANGGGAKFSTTTNTSGVGDVKYEGASGPNSTIGGGAAGATGSAVDATGVPPGGDGGNGAAGTSPGGGGGYDGGTSYSGGAGWVRITWA